MRVRSPTSSSKQREREQVLEGGCSMHSKAVHGDFSLNLSPIFVHKHVAERQKRGVFLAT